MVDIKMYCRTQRDLAPRGRPTDRDRIVAGSTVRLHYTLLLADGTVIESTEETQAFTYLHGQGQLVPGLEQALEGRRAGTRVHVVVPPDLGYGELNPKLVRRIPKDHASAATPLRAGVRVGARLEDGTTLQAWILDVYAQDVLVSFNHPLAGHDLHFEIDILSVEAPR